jgi:hypothetical protein
MKRSFPYNTPREAGGSSSKRPSPSGSSTAADDVILAPTINIPAASPGLNTMSLLHDDALQAVLLRTRASDHPSLRLSCPRICHIIDSELYRRQRNEQGFAEVHLALLSAEEQYERKLCDGSLYLLNGEPPQVNAPDDGIDENFDNNFN